MKYAGLISRIIAFWIDSFFCSIGSYGIYFISGGILGEIGIPEKIIIFITVTIVIIAIWLYFTLMESSPKQATFGKRQFDIIVGDLEGNRISFGKASVRYCALPPV